jgi:hypothetical protein
MKIKLAIVSLFTLLVAFSIGIYADTAGNVAAPFTTPSYTPPVVLTPITLSIASSGAQNITIPVAGASTFLLKVSGTCTSLAGTVLGSADNGTTYTAALNLWALPTAGTTASLTPLASFTATNLGIGVKVNTQGLTKLKVVISANSGTTCVISGAGTTGGFSIIF